MKRFALVLFACGLLAACAGSTVAPQMSGVAYEITVVRNWSETTHPLDWPGAAGHFTGAIGAIHNDKYAMFGAGKIATPGLELLSQKGMGTLFRQEIEAEQGRGTVDSIITLDPIRMAGGSSTMQVRATDAHPLVSFAMMVAPSPDWFTGVTAIALKRNGQWIESETVTLYAWDSGTNDAKTYKAAKIAVNPFVPITINAAPMFVMGGNRIAVGTATIRKVGG